MSEQRIEIGVYKFYHDGREWLYQYGDNISRPATDVEEVLIVELTALRKENKRFKLGLTRVLGATDMNDGRDGYLDSERINSARRNALYALGRED